MVRDKNVVDVCWLLAVADKARVCSMHKHVICILEGDVLNVLLLFVLATVSMTRLFTVEMGRWE